MKLKHWVVILIVSFFISAFTNVALEKELPICLSAKEMKLFDAINKYRKENGLPEIKLSSSLSKVAQSHAYDLSYNRPFSTKCNMHSWSDKGKWSSCCYTEDHSKASCMWEKPQELTRYKGFGFEISHGFSQFEKFSGDTVTVETALDGWKKSKGHNDVILNKEIWVKMKWNAVGIGINRDFACVWFGTEPDTEGIPTICN